MQAIAPTLPVSAEPQNRIRALGRRIAVPVVLLAVVVTLVGLAGSTARDLFEAKRLVARSYADTANAIDAARSASATLAHLRADRMRAWLITNHDERVRFEDRIEERHHSLATDLSAIATRTRSVRVSQAAVAAQDAVAIWYQSMQADAGGRDRLAEFDRLVEFAEAQLGRLAEASARYGLGAEKSAEAAVSEQIGVIQRLAGAASLLALLVVGGLVLRRRRFIAAASATLERLASGQAADGISAGEARALGGLLPPLTKLYGATLAKQGRSGPVPVADALAAAHDGVVIVDAEDRIAYANTAAGVLLGMQAEVLQAGAPASPLLAMLGLPVDAVTDLDTKLPDGRWLGASRSPLPDGGALLILSDIGERKIRESQSTAQAASIRTALDAMSQGLCLYDSSHRLVITNRRYEEIYHHEPGTLQVGMTAADVLERSILAGNHPGRTLGDLLGEAGAVIAASPQDDHFQELDGGRIIQINVGPTPDCGFVATYEDVTERWHAESRIAYMARHDGLTDLPNRLLLAERIEGAITQASRDSGFAVHCLDLDNFKQINDTLGHAVGDELLHAVAHRLTACLREVDTVARLGGDEFAIVQADVGKPEDAAILARRVIEVVGAPYELTDHSVTIGVSIGIAMAPADGMAVDRLLKNADVALYKSKGDGRGVFRFFEAEMDARLQARRLLEIDLRAAVAAEVFELHYQPIYDLTQDRICGFEALLRWTHPTRGRVSPAEFIPLAEEIGLIVPLGDWVLRRACAEASGWPDDLKIAVNVSPAQFHSAELIRTVRETLTATGLAAHRLELEITETVLLSNRGATVAILHALRSLGTRISMDDFGTGYSSLSYLRSFPFDKMKIDQSFIRDLTIENGSGFIVQAVISLGSNLGMTMTAEGVETEEQLARLREEGCDEVQGYLFSPPVPVGQIAGLLDKWNGPGEASAKAA